MTTPALCFIFFVVLITALVVAVFYLIAMQIKSSNEALQKQREWWYSVGNYLGLEVTSYPSSELGMLEGVSKGYWTRIIRTHRTDLQKDVTRILTYHNPPLQLGLEVRRAGTSGVFDQMFGDRGIQTGDAAFDARFQISGHDPEVILNIFNADLRDQMVRYDHSTGALDFNDTYIGLDLVGDLPPVEQMTNVLEAQRAIVTRLTKAATEVRSQVEAPQEAYHTR